MMSACDDDDDDEEEDDNDEEEDDDDEEEFFVIDNYKYNCYIKMMLGSVNDMVSECKLDVRKRFVK